MYCDLSQALKELWLSDETLAAMVPSEKIYTEDVAYNEVQPPYVVIRELGEFGSRTDDVATLRSVAYRLTLVTLDKVQQRSAKILAYYLYSRSRFTTDEGQVHKCTCTTRTFRTEKGVRVLWINLQLRVGQTTPHVRFFEEI